MVSFVCDYCQETLKKSKLDQHTYRCREAQFTCIDCNTTFAQGQYRNHTKCISEEEKYQGKLYKPKQARPSTGPTLIEQIKQEESKTAAPVEKKRKRESAEVEIEWNNATWNYPHKVKGVCAAVRHVVSTHQPIHLSQLSSKVVDLISKHPQNPFKKTCKIEKILNEKIMIEMKQGECILKLND